MKKTIKDIKELENKKVIVRVDFNVPVKENKVMDVNRIIQSLPTLKYLKEKNAKIILLSHLGRISSEEDKKNKSLEVVANELENQSGWKVKFIPATRGQLIEDAINSMNSGEIVMLENTRFEDFVDGENVKNESKNNDELGKYWASLADIFINDAFGTAHRAHASNVGIATNINESAIGFLIEKEVKYLGQVLENPKRPFVALLGGAKVSDKIQLINKMASNADKLIIGPAIAFTFRKEQGHKIGSSMYEEDKMQLARELMNEFGDKLVIASNDAICNKEFKDEEGKVFEEIDDGWMGMDIGPKTIELIKNELKGAKTVIWNGPFGVAEFENYKNGSELIAKEIAKITNDGGTTIIGGGDSVAMAINLGLADQFSHISTGGGSSIEFLEGKPLPGIDSINNK